MDVLEFDAIGQAAAIRSGQIDSRELGRAAMKRLAESDALLNSVVWFRDEDEVFAGPAEGETGGPFAGVPIVLKDLPAWQRGVPVGLGVRALEQAGMRAIADSPCGAGFGPPGS